MTDVGRQKLTKAVVDKIARTARPGQRFWDAKLPGYGLRIGARTITYFVQHDIRGKTVIVTIGRHGEKTPAQARKKAEKTLSKMRDGINPNAEKRREKALGVTLEEACAEYLNTKDLAPSTRKDYDRIVNSVLKDWRHKPITSITKEMVIKKHKRLGEEN